VRDLRSALEREGEMSESPQEFKERVASYPLGYAEGYAAGVLAERERCAKVADDNAERQVRYLTENTSPMGKAFSIERRNVCQLIAAAIRALPTP
jgi:hypothetical protein